MCLSNVKKKFKSNDNMRVGYKVFNKSCKADRAYYSQIYTTNVPRKLGRVYTATTVPFIVSADGRQSYASGFHIWSTLKGAQLDRSDRSGTFIVKVIAWDIRASGQNRTSCYDEYERACFVAKNIRLMEEIKE